MMTRNHGGLPPASRMIAAAMTSLCIVLTGCSKPSYKSTMWMPADRDLTVQVWGEKPTIELANSGPGAIGRLTLINDHRTLSSGGLPPGGSSEFTLSNQEKVILSHSSGCNVTIKVWDATGFQMTNGDGKTVVSEPAAH